MQNGVPRCSSVHSKRPGHSSSIPLPFCGTLETKQRRRKVQEEEISLRNFLRNATLLTSTLCKFTSSGLEKTENISKTILAVTGRARIIDFRLFRSGLKQRKSGIEYNKNGRQYQKDRAEEQKELGKTSEQLPRETKEEYGAKRKRRGNNGNMTQYCRAKTKEQPRIQTPPGSGSDRAWALDWISFVLPKVETNEVVDLQQRTEAAIQKKTRHGNQQRRGQETKAGETEIVNMAQ